MFARLHLKNLLGSTRMFFEGEAGGAGGGGNGNPPPDKTNDKGGAGNNANNKNNSGDFSLEEGNIWEQPRTEDGNNKRQPNGNEANRANNDETVMRGFDDFVAKKNWKFELGAEDIQKFVQNGDITGLQNAILKSQREMYRETMLDSSKMVNAAIDRAVNAAVERATGNFQTDKAKTTLQTVVPLAKNPNVAPIAEAIMSTFIKKGQDHDTAARNVSKVFDAIRNVKGKDIGVEDPPRGRNDTRGSRAADDGDEELIDWLSFAKQATQ